MMRDVDVKLNPWLPCQKNPSKKKKSPANWT